MTLQRKTPLRRDGEGARRFADQRSNLNRAPIRRGDPPPSAGAQLRRTALRSRSRKRSDFMRDVRAPQVRALRAAGARCELGPVIAAAGGASGCTGHVEGLHERRKRSAGGSLVNPRNLMASCNRCNSFVECEPALIRELTGTALVVREGDPEWVALGKRAD